jgi:hypothetical protein
LKKFHFPLFKNQNSAKLAEREFMLKLINLVSNWLELKFAHETLSVFDEKLVSGEKIMTVVICASNCIINPQNELVTRHHNLTGAPMRTVRMGEKFIIIGQEPIAPVNDRGQVFDPVLNGYTSIVVVGGTIITW